MLKLNNGIYVEVLIEEMWQAWKASRESMNAIKFPDIKTESLNGKETGIVEHVSLSYKLAITSAGYKVER